MKSPLSPTVLCLTDDDDDDDGDDNDKVDQNILYDSLLTTTLNESSSYAKRKVAETNFYTNSSRINWSKRLRNDNCKQQQQKQRIRQNSVNHAIETIVIDSDESTFEEEDSHLCTAFGRTNITPILTRRHSHATRRTSRPLFPPSYPMMDVVKHCINQLNTVPMIPVIDSNDTYI